MIPVAKVLLELQFNFSPTRSFRHSIPLANTRLSCRVTQEVWSSSFVIAFAITQIVPCSSDSITILQSNTYAVPKRTYNRFIAAPPQFGGLKRSLRTYLLFVATSFSPFCNTNIHSDPPSTQPHVSWKSMSLPHDRMSKL